MKYFLYRLDPEGEAEIFGRFNTLSEAKLSSKLLLIQESCFILSGDIKYMFTYADNKWTVDIITDEGKLAFLECFKDPSTYIDE